MNEVPVTRQVVDNIRGLRAERRWLASQLAGACALVGAGSLTGGTISKIESGARKRQTEEELTVLAQVVQASPPSLIPPTHGPVF